MNGRLVILDQVAAGSRLALDVCDHAGRIMLAAGTELTDAALASLRQRGVSQLHIEEALSEQELAARREAVAQRLAHLFRQTENPLMARLHDVVLAYRLEQWR